MRKLPVIVLLVAVVLWGSQTRGTRAGQEEEAGAATPASDAPVKVTIATGGGPYDPPKDRFKVGEEIPVVVTMTNTGDEPAQYCLSTTIIQNRPQLARDGKPVPYLTNLPQQVDTERAVERCEGSAFRRFYTLQPKQTRVVDWIEISRRNIDWYGSLPPGHYELVLMRRVECCKGRMLKSNKIAFEVVP